MQCDSLWICCMARYEARPLLRILPGARSRTFRCRFACIFLSSLRLRLHEARGALACMSIPSSQETGKAIKPQIGHWLHMQGIWCFGKSPHASDDRREREKSQLDTRVPLLQYREGIINATC